MIDAGIKRLVTVCLIMAFMVSSTGCGIVDKFTGYMDYRIENAHEITDVDTFCENLGEWLSFNTGYGHTRSAWDGYVVYSIVFNRLEGKRYVDENGMLIESESTYLIKVESSSADPIDKLLGTGAYDKD